MQVARTVDRYAVTGKVTKDGRLYPGDVPFSMKQTSWGFVATAVGDGENIVSLRRQSAARTPSANFTVEKQARRAA